MRGLPVLALLVLSGLGPIDAYSQQLVPNPVIGGIPLHCVFPSGVPVLTTMAPINDWAAARVVPTPTGTVAVITLNPHIVPGLPAPVQWFLYGHECMHHLLGHTLWNVTIGLEVDADCQAVKLLRNQGFLNANSVQLVAAYFQNNPPQPPFYPPGPERAGRLRACFSVP